MLENRQWYDRGEELKREGDLQGALDAYRQSLKINPRVAAPWVGLADVLETNQQPLDALECLKRALAAEPRNVIVATRVARAFHGLGMLDDASRAYERALTIEPGRVNALLGYGQWHEDTGDAAGAATCYRKILEREPGQPDALGAIVGLGRSIDVSAEIDAAKRAMDSGDDRAKALIGYGLGRALDRLEEHRAAFETLTVANAARRAQAGPFDRQAFDGRIDQLINIFSAEFFRERHGWGDPSDGPVFVVGLPRSGTTLTEQIIGSHPDCFGAGELNILTDLATGTPDRLGREDHPWPACAPGLDAGHASAIGADYVARTAKLTTQTPRRLIDKQPLNFWALGLVAMALPRATILHCTRDIRDNGFSIFSQNFSTHQRWSTDLDDIAYYWQGYRRLMAHWNEVTNLKIVDVVYEETIDNLETQARRLLHELDLPWDEQVLSFHSNDRAVQTPSQWQVRQPLYKTSAAKWQRYQEQLLPLRAAYDREMGESSQ